MSARAPSRFSIAVVQGGPSVEAEVSRASAKAVANALAAAGHSAVRMELDAFLAESLRSGGYEVVFPVSHGAVGEDGSLQGLLEVLEMPYVGSGVLASALAMDKAHARRVFEQSALPIARGIAVRRGEETSLAAAERARRDVSKRLVVKPGSAGSGIGVARFDESAEAREIAAGIEAAWGLDDVAILEHFARGREVTCGVLDLGAGDLAGIRAFPPTEIASPKDVFYTYAARYAPGRSVHTCPAELGEALTSRVQSIAVAAHRALGCRDLSRADMIVGDDGDSSVITLLEVNTMPGFTGTSLYPEAGAVASIPFPALCDALVRNARARGTMRRNVAKPFPR